jgi:hypothetical protein
MSRPPSLAPRPLVARLRARLREIETCVRDQRMPRSEAGDLIAKEVVPPLQGARDEEARELLCDARVLMALLFHDSAAVDPRETAAALLSAASLHAALPARIAREATLHRLFHRVEARLRDLCSQRTRTRVVQGLLHFRRLDNVPEAELQGDLALVAPLLRDLSDAPADPAVLALIEGVRPLATRPGLARVLDGILDAAAALLVQWRDPRAALPLADRLDGAGKQALADLLQGEAVLPDEAGSFLLDRIAKDPAERARWEPRLEPFVHVSTRHGPVEAMAREAVARELGRHYPRAAWPFYAQAVAAARRGDDVLCAAAYAAALDRGSTAIHGLSRIAGALAAIGLYASARELARQDPGIDAADPLRRVLEALAGGSGIEDPDLAGAIGRVPEGLRVCALRMRAAWHREAGEHRAERRLLEEALQVRPNHQDLHVEAARAATAEGDVQAARALLAPVPPEDPRAQLAQAELAAAEGRGEAAIAAYLRFAEAGAQCARSDLRARLARRFELLGGGRPADSATLRRFASELRASERERQRRCDLEIAAARAAAAEWAERTGHPGRALEAMVPVLRGKHADAQSLANAVRLSVLAGEPRRALEVLDHACALRRPSGPIQALRGLVAILAGDVAAARPHLEAAAKEDPPPPAALLGLALLDAHAGAMGSARTSLARVPAGGPWSGPAAELIASLFEHEGAWDRAVEARRILRDRDAPARFAFGRAATFVGLRRLLSETVEPPLLAEGLAALEGLEAPEATTLIELTGRIRERRARDAARLWLEEAKTELRLGGDPHALLDLLRKAQRALPGGSRIGPLLARAQKRVEDLVTVPTLPGLSARIRAGGRPADLVHEAEEVAVDSPDPRAHHHLFLLRLALAHELDRDGHPGAASEFERVHQVFLRWTAMPGWGEQLPGEPVPAADLAAARDALARRILAHHRQRSVELAGSDPALAECHARLLTRSPLLVSEREQRRLDIWLAQSSGVASGPDLQGLRDRAGLLLRADPENEHALFGLFRAEMEAAEVELQRLALGQSVPAALEAIEAHVEFAGCAVRAVDDEVQTSYDTELARLLRIWHLVAAVEAGVVARDWARGRQSLRAAEEVPVTEPLPWEPGLRERLAWEDPEADPLAEVAHAVARGEDGEVEARLIAAHERAAAMGSVTRARRAIELLDHLRSNRAVARQCALLESARRALAEGRAQAAIDLLGGRTPPSRLDLAPRVLRAEAWLALRQPERAEAEFDLLERSGFEPGAAASEIAALRAAIARARDPRTGATP